MGFDRVAPVRQDGHNFIVRIVEEEFVTRWIASPQKLQLALGRFQLVPERVRFLLQVGPDCPRFLALHLVHHTFELLEAACAHDAVQIP